MNNKDYEPQLGPKQTKQSPWHRCMELLSQVEKAKLFANAKPMQPYSVQSVELHLCVLPRHFVKEVWDHEGIEMAKISYVVCFEQIG